MRRLASALDARQVKYLARGPLQIWLTRSLYVELVQDSEFVFCEPLRPGVGICHATFHTVDGTVEEILRRLVS